MQLWKLFHIDTVSKVVVDNGFGNQILFLVTHTSILEEDNPGLGHKGRSLL